jgi:hypothetical protein
LAANPKAMQKARAITMYNPMSTIHSMELSG